MNCEECQSLLVRYTREELNPTKLAAVKRHLLDCGPCRAELVFHRSLDAQLQAQMNLPDSLLRKVESRIARTPTRPTLRTRLLGDPTMKRILVSSSALAAMFATALLFTSTTAKADSALSLFKSMKSSLAYAARSGEVTFTASVDGKGGVTVSGKLDGVDLPTDFPMHVSVIRTGEVYDITVNAELSPANFSSITYGNDDTTLRLVPKGHDDQKIEVGVEPTNHRILSWTSYRKVDGAWKQVAHNTYKAPSKALPSKETSSSVLAHIKIDATPNSNGKISIGSGPKG